MYSQEESEEVTIYLKKFVTEIPEIDGSTALSAEFLWFEAGSADTVPIASQTPHEIVDTRFRVTDIPTVMKDTLNWPKSAELMELWFSLDAREMTKREKEGKTKTSDYPKENTNTTMFTWVWMKQFEQVTPAVKELLTKLQTQNAIKAIRSNLANHLKGHPTVERPIKINNPLNPVFLHSNWQFQYINVGYDIGKVDDLYGSLGNFALYAAITKCTVKRKIITNEQLIHINEIGIYMKDTYDFLGNQYLGNWGYGSFAISPSSGMLNSLEIESHDGAVAFEDGEYLTAFGNEDYRRHRERTSRGGDLLLFSDVKTFPVDIFLSLEQ